VFQQSIGSAIKAQCSASLAILSRFAVLLAAVILTVCSAHASGNLLANGSFNSGSASWTHLYLRPHHPMPHSKYPNRLEGTSTNPPTWPHGQGNSWPAGAGTNFAAEPRSPRCTMGRWQLTCGASGGAGVAMAYQTVAGSPGVAYTLTCQAGAQNCGGPRVKSGFGF